MEIRDIYGRLIDGMQGAQGMIRTGGDAPGGGMAMQGQPAQRETCRALFRHRGGRRGRHRRGRFDIPAFDGTLRLMAVAWSKTQVGHAVSDVIVRDPVTLLGTAPHFLTLATSRSSI